MGLYPGSRLCLEARSRGCRPADSVVALRHNPFCRPRQGEAAATGPGGRCGHIAKAGIEAAGLLYFPKTTIRKRAEPQADAQRHHFPAAQRRSVNGTVCPGNGATTVPSTAPSNVGCKMAFSRASGPFRPQNAPSGAAWCEMGMAVGGLRHGQGGPWSVVVAGRGQCA